MTLIEPLLSGAVAVLGYVALLHGGTAVVSRGRVVSTSFGLLAGIAALYVYFGLRTYTATDPESYLTFRQWQVALAFIVSPVLAWFVQAFTGLRVRWPLFVITGIYTAFLVAFLAGWMGDPAGLSEADFVRLPWGETIASKSPGMERGEWLIQFSYWILWLYLIWGTVYLFRSRGRAQAVILGFGLSLFWWNAEVLPEAGGLRALPWDEFGFFGLSVVMGFHLTGRAIAVERAERELARSRRRLRSLIEEAPYGILLYDDGEGRFTEVNAKAEALVGTSRAELLASSPSALWRLRYDESEDFPDELVATYERCLREGSSRLEWEFRDPEGDVRIWHLNLVHLSDSEAPRIRIGISDVTAQRLAERRAGELSQQLQQAQRLEAVGHLSAGVAHDFNNLLAIIAGNLDLLRFSSKEFEEEDRQLLEEATEAVARGSALTRRLLTFARKAPTHREPVEVAAETREVVRLLRRTLPASIGFELSMEDGLWAVDAQRGLVQDAILNLCLNARDAMPDGGRLQVELSNVRVSAERAKESGVEPGDYVRIRVTDTGVGMPPKVVERVFEPFFTTRDEAGGSGLGLSMVWGFVKQVGGTIDIDSTPGEGTTVRMDLPRSLAGSGIEPEV